MSHIVPILMYHSVDAVCDPAYRRWNVRPEHFRRHMNVLAQGSYRVCTVAQLISYRIAGMAPPERTVVLTFDDGLRDFLTGALPILEEFRFPASLFVVADRLGRTSDWLAPLGEGMRPMLSAAELREVAERGIEIGGHTMTHPQLDLIAIKALQSEVAACKARLEDVLGAPITSFAYPHGYSNGNVRKAVRAAGFTAACRVRHALSTVSEDPYSLSRIIVTEDMPDALLLQFLGGAGLPVAPPVETLPIRGWRFYRKMKHLAGIAS